MCPIYHIGKSSKRMSERLRFATFRIKCFLWAEKLQAEPITGFGFASDLSEAGVGIYVDAKIPVGTSVRIALEEGDTEPYAGTVAWCQRYTLGQKFHGHAALDHRVGVRFHFRDEAERQRYLMYFNELKRKVTVISKDRLF
jgi:hypothetical protein